MQQQQQDATMIETRTISAAVFGRPGTAKTASAPLRSRIRRLPHRERIFESLDDG